MLERLIENWLTKATEKSFQIPFCYMLASEGYTILHMTRHCGMEHGKDIIALDPAGTPCAFQLKGAPEGKIKLKHWQQELVGQVNQLVFTPITHPSVAITSPHHKSYFVTNGELEEEVFNAIDAQNKKNVLIQQPQFHLQTIVKGELIEKAKRLGLSFIPPNLPDFRNLIDFFMVDGKGILNKDSFAKLLESFFEQEVKSSRQGELIRGSAILTALATSSYSNTENHVALVEAWMMYISYLFWFAEKNNVPEKEWKNEFEIAQQIIWTSLENLWAEVESKKYLIIDDENFMEDMLIRDYRMTWFAGLFSALGIYYKFHDKEDKIAALKTFIRKREHELNLWGESAIPNLLSYYWLKYITEATLESGAVLQRIIRTIIFKSTKREELFPDPYYDIDQSLSLFQEKEQKVIDEINQKYVSYYLEAMVNIFVRENLLQTMKNLWPDISKIFFKRFSFVNQIDFYRWRNKEGKEVTLTPPPTKSWKVLKDESNESMGAVVPKELKNKPYLIPLFLIVFPHRADPSLVRWYDTYLRKNF